MPPRMHHDEVDVDADLAARLIARQFSDLAALPLRLVEPWGTDHGVWRLGDEFVVRLPRIDWAAGQPEKEAHWLPVLADHLPVFLPEPVGLGEPDLGYPFHWAIHRWLPGELAFADRIVDPHEFARDLAAVVVALGTVPIDDAPPPHGRARPLADYDVATRDAIERCRSLIDVDAALEVWEDALSAPAATGPGRWVQGDLDGNCLVADGRLSGIVDWGSACVGDLAVDIAVVWSSLFTPATAGTFLDIVEPDEATVRRARGVVVNQCCMALPYYVDTYPLIIERSRHKLQRLGIDVRPCADQVTNGTRPHS